MSIFHSGLRYQACLKERTDWTARLDLIFAPNLERARGHRLLYHALPSDRHAITLNLYPPIPDHLLKQLMRHGCALLLGVSSVAGWTDELTESGVSADLDWQPLIQIPEEDRDQRCRQCKGRYVDPLAGVDTSVAPLDAELQVAAAESEVTETDAVFEGDVRIQQGYRVIRADRVEVDRAEETALATGHVTLREPGVLIRGDTVTYNSRSEVADVYDANFVLHNRGMAGAADQLTRLADGRIEIEDGRMSYCPPDDPDWVMHAETLKIDPATGDGQAWGAKLKLSGVPVMYLPWIRFPVDSRRKTGLLFPDIGSDTRGGIDITAPIYLNLAPNYDALYSPRFIQERGLLHQTKFRWLSEHTGLWELSGGWIGDDSKYQDDYPTEDGNRWLIGAKQQGSFGDHFRTYVNFTRVSDYEYLKDLENNSLSAQRQTALQQLGRVEWVNSQWLLQLDFEQFQSLAKDIPEDYRKLPQFTAMWIGEAAWQGIRPIVTSQLSHFDIDTDRVTGQRFYNEIGLTQPRQWAFGFLTPTVKYRSVQYELDRPFLPLDTSPTAGSFTGSVDGGLIFERQTTLGGAAMTQTLEPRVYYLYSEFDEQPYQPVFDSAELTFSYGQLYRDTRFSGNDRLDDANQLSAGVTTRFFDNTTGEERLNASIGQIFYFKDRKIRLNATDPVLAEATSPIAGEFNWLPNSAWRISASALYDTNDNTFDAASAQVTLFTDHGAVISSGYTLREPPPSLFQRPVTEQANVSAYWPINDEWSVFGALEYSLEGSTAVEDMFGVEYDDCCWRVRLLYMRYIDTELGEIADFNDPNLNRENAVQLQVVLKGMGGFGGRVDNLLSDMIRGFTDRRVP